MHRQMVTPSIQFKDKLFRLKLLGGLYSQLTYLNRNIRGREQKGKQFQKTGGLHISLADVIFLPRPLCRDTDIHYVYKH